jgi:hypothetical protein
MSRGRTALEAARAAALDVVAAGRALAAAAEGLWAGAVLAAAERFAFEVRWYEQDLERRLAEEAALQKEQHCG